MLNTLCAPVSNVQIFIRIRIRILHVVHPQIYRSADPHYTCSLRIKGVKTLRDLGHFGPDISALVLKCLSQDNLAPGNTGPRHGKEDGCAFVIT